MGSVIKVLSTGGTIACTQDSVWGVVPALTAEDLVRAVPELQDVAQIEVETFSTIPSDYMGPSHWHRLARRVAELAQDARVTGIVITHGTDTLEETAYFLDLTVDTEKPVVLTGAQRVFSVRDSDGPRNLLAAVRVAAAPHARGLGVLVVLGGLIHAARDATKVHTSAVSAFGSGDLGPLGVVDEEQVIIARRPTRRIHLPLGERICRVDIIPMYAGADRLFIDAALAAGAHGLVIQACGRGNVNQPLYEGVVEAVARGVSVVIASRVPAGRVYPVYDFVGGGRSLLAAGAIGAGDLNPQKARVLLLVARSVDRTPAEIAHIFHEADRQWAPPQAASL